MCIWLLTACLGAVGNYPPYGPIVSGGAPPPIIVPTSPPAPLPTFAPSPSTAAPTTTASPTTTTAATTTTARPTTPTAFPTFPTLPTLPPLTPVPTSAPITAPPGTIPTQQPIPLIDPRLPLTQTEPLTRFGDIAYEDVVIEAAPEVEYNTEALYFSRDKRSIYDDVEVFREYDTTENHTSIAREKRQTTTCACLPEASCPGGNTDGTGLIDFRIVAGQTNPSENCTRPLRYCCGIQVPIGQVSCGSRLQSPTVYPTQAGQSRYGDFPWMVVILTIDNQYVGGGTLIDTQHVITAAHRITSYPNGVGIKIRVGEWDAAGNYEQYPYRDFSILRVWVHESFNRNNLHNDIALIRLISVIPPGTPAVIPVCLPSPGQTFDGRRCWVSGWGKDAFGTAGRYQTILKTVDVPIIAQNTCETNFRATRLGSTYVYDRTSFICAGGEVNKDACTGDGGSGLVCELTTGRWTVAGLVAWGLGCAAQGVPGAYVNVVSYLTWISPKVAS